MGLVLYINDNQIELSDQSKIGLTYQVHDLNSLGNRQGILTNEFKVPKTKANQISLEYASSLNSNTNVPYTRNKAKVVQDGIEIIPDGFAIIQSFDGFYKITVYSGNLDLFDLIGDSLITDLDFSDLVHNWTYANVLASAANDESDGYIYPLVDWGKNANAINPGLGVLSNKLFLFVFCKWIFDKIVGGRGYVVNGTYHASDMLANLILSVDKWVKSAAYMLENTVSATLTADDGGNFFDSAPLGGGSTNTGQVFNVYMDSYTSPEMNFLPAAIFEPAVTKWGTLRLQGSILFEKVGIHYDNCEYIFDITQVAGPGSPALIVSEPGWTTIDMFPSGSVEHSFDISVFGQFAAGSQFQARLTMKSNLPTSTGDGINFTYRAGNCYSFTPLNTLGPGDEVDPVALLPQIKQKDFIKGLCNQASVVFQSDVIRKEISFNFLDDIIANLPRAKDWSDKIDPESITITYRNSNYAQKNWLRYKPDDTVEEFYGDGSIDCADENLEKEKDLFVLPFAASEHYLNLGGKMVPQIKSYVSSSQFEKAEPRILRLRKEAGTGIKLYDSQTSSSSAYADAPLCYFDETDTALSLRFDPGLIATRYRTVSAILLKYKELSAAFKLSAVDISELDFLIPIYLDVHTPKHDINGYFYLNKVSNYKGGQLTACNLIRL